MNSIVIETIIEDVPIVSIHDSTFENMGPKFTAGRVTVCSGTVLAVSDVHRLTETASYSCPDVACVGSTEYRITKPTLSGTKKLEVATCAYCSTQLTEELHKRSSSETVYFLLLPQPIRGPGKSAGSREILPTIDRAVLCAISGKLIRKLHLGMQVHLIGIPELIVVDDSFQWLFKVQNAEYTPMNILDPWKCALNTVIDKLPSYVHNFEFGIVFTLTYMFLEDVSPNGSYFLLKWLLLLLLVQDDVNNKSFQSDPTETFDDQRLPSAIEQSYRQEQFRPPALLLLSSLSCPMADRLLHAAARHAHPFWEHKPGRKLLPSALEPDAFGLKRPIGTGRSQTAEKERRSIPKASRYRSPYSGKLDNVTFKSTSMCYSGTLDLASGGVAYFPSIELLKRKELVNLLCTLENINVVSATLSDGKISQQVNNARTNLSCISIWATSDIIPDKSRKISERLSNMEGTPLVVSSTDEVHSANELISRRKGLQRVLCAFDLIVNMETAGGEDEILDSLLADHWLRGSMTCVSNTNRDDAIGNTTQIFDSVLSSYSASATPEIPPDASRLLQAYYLAVRQSCTNDRYAVPSTALTTLFKLTRANAKLNGHSTVRPIDATIAVYLYDTFVENHTGTTYLGSRPLHYVRDMNCESMNELNEILQGAYAQLMGLINVGFTEVLKDGPKSP
ncbi:hypothetical protein EG68_05537 [Paragonimus skrjabini miyazakii]|uniref:MCM AAA-lid domain-containing protein n=1 Tax=Paragonimus skrjabini miyazakii TaxID=59628 RepID=A0A8S9YRE6_9TREM|nr:hypothetical protein EG68_05537 [Paragonimus skrjabini miyazakii]